MIAIFHLKVKKQQVKKKQDQDINFQSDLSFSSWSFSSESSDDMISEAEEGITESENLCTKCDVHFYLHQTRMVSEIFMINKVVNM